MNGAQTASAASAVEETSAPRFLCVGTDWDGHPSSMSLLFRAVARTHEVVWVNSLGQRMPQLTHRDLARLWRKGAHALHLARTADRGANDALVGVVNPRVIPLHRFAPVRRLNGWLLERQLRPYFPPARASSASRPIVFATSNPAAVALLARIRPALSLYYCMDDYAEMDDCDPVMIRRCESLLLDAVDCAFATSLNLCRRKSASGRPVLHLPQGVDFEHFQEPGECPRPLRTLARPLIGFQGIVGTRLDLVLLEKILRAFPHASVVTLGRREIDLTHLARYANFHHFDAVPYADLPRWVARFDIGLIAYKQDGHTDAVNPLKLLEYLAASLPVVSVALPELAQHVQFVSLARDHDDYLEAVGGWLRRGPLPEVERQARRAYAANASWARRAQQFLRVCDTLLAQRGRPGVG